MDILMAHNITYEMYKTDELCAEPIEKLIKITKIPTESGGSCLFDSLKITCNLKMTAKELSRQLFKSTALDQYEYAEEAKQILASDSEYGNVDCLHIFFKTLEKKYAYTITCLGTKLSTVILAQYEKIKNLYIYIWKIHTSHHILK
jgi:hypothetical protein